METHDRLDDGSPPADPAALELRLQELGIRTRTIHHPPVFTVEESKALRGELAGCHTKNLFVRDKKGVMWLVVCREDRQVDLAAIAGQLGVGRLSFGSADRLMPSRRSP
jgi:Ala-tRNA(Pro) deacylase